MLQKQKSPWNFWSLLKISEAHCGVKVNFDHLPTLGMVDVKFKPMAPGSKPSVRKTYPDMGCEEIMIFAELINSVGFKVKNVKTVEAVDGGKVQCLAQWPQKSNTKASLPMLDCWLMKFPLQNGLGRPRDHQPILPQCPTKRTNRQTWSKGRLGGSPRG